MAEESLLDRLLEAKLISLQHHAAAAYASRNADKPVEDYLLEIGALREEDLLRFLAAAHGVQYLSKEKIKGASIPRSILDMVPVKLVDAVEAIPIRWDRATRTLSVITARPDDLDMLSQMRAAAGVRNVQPVYARPLVVRAAIRKWFHDDAAAFDTLEAKPVATDVAPPDVGDLGGWLESTSRPPPAPAAAAPQQPTVREVPAQPAPAEPDEPIAPISIAPPVPTRIVEVPPDAVAAADYLETLNVLVSLAENSRQELRGHSSITARHARELAARLGLSPADGTSAAVAAYLHDLGKGSPFHLTALNVAEWEGHRDNARRAYEAPLRLFESVGLRPEASRAIRHMYERFDGKGFPTGLRGKEIPLGARILAIVDTFADLTHNPRNPFRRVLNVTEAVAVFDRHRDTVFDGDLVDIFRLVVAGSDLRQRLLEGNRSILVVDGDAEQSAALEMRLLGRGFDVQVARSADIALRALVDTEIHVVVSEVNLEPFDGFELLRRARAEQRAKTAPFLFLTTRHAAEDVAKAFELGAADYVVKPSTTEVVIAKIRQTFERAAATGPTAGVSGSLSDMSLPDLVQILAQGRKTGKLTIQGEGGRQGEIHFLEGRVANAAHGEQRGEEAFYAMLSIEQGTFALDPGFRPESVVIRESAEALLLEGMRRLDEAGR